MTRSVSIASVTGLAAIIVACSGTPQTPLSPSTGMPDGLASSHGAGLKAAPPGTVSPSGGATIEGLRPTFSWTPASGRHAQLSGLTYRLLVMNAAGDPVAERTTTGTSLEADSDLAYATTYSWQVRAELEGQATDWSGTATFRTPDPPPPPTPPAGVLPFVVPASCGPRSPATGDRSQCAVDVAAVSPAWPACRAGSGTNCHRYARHLAAALATGDPKWGLITKNPGEQQCSWDACGRSVSGGYGEDVVAYRHGPTDFDWEGWDVVLGAGGPGANVNWTRLSSRRPGNNWAPVPPFP
ncbi:MAG: hypothetical protein AB1635_02365 [Acidobacteriota bacterium]